MTEAGSNDIPKEQRAPLQEVEEHTGGLEEESNVLRPADTASLLTPQTPKEVRTLTRNAEKLQIDTGNSQSQDVGKDLPASPPPPQPPSAQEKPYLDPTPKTPTLSRHPSDRSTKSRKNEEGKGLDKTPAANVQAGGPVDDDDNDNESVSEIQSIMEQFTDETAAPSKEEIMSPRHEAQNPFLDSTGKYPPRRSSLEPLRSRDMDVIAQSPVVSVSEKHALSPPPVPPKPSSTHVSSPIQTHRVGSTTSLSKQLPEPEPEPELPFDFHRFLEQLRHKSADPVAKFLRSFLNEFGKKQWMVHEQVKIIGDFLAFITNKMALCEVWREVSDNEFDNAKEGMEKLVMNRLYAQTFSPAIAPPPTAPRGRGKRKEPEKSTGPGRRGQHQEDIERDEILAQKIRIYSWVREEHLDITPVGPNGERFLRLAQQELLKIKGYRAPRDKVICILNCCKVIFGLLKNATSSDTSADSFVPLLIFVVLQSNPEHLVSNIQYILRFRNQDKLGGEAGYYLSSLSGAIQFVESLDRTTLTVSDEDFERNVELAVSAIAEQNREVEPTSPQPHMSEKPVPSEAEAVPSSPRKKSQSRDRPRLIANSEGTDDEPAVAGLLRTIQKPLNTIGRIFSDQETSEQGTGESGMLQRRASPIRQQSSVDDSQSRKRADGEPHVQSYDAQEAAARQASAEAAEARRIQRAEHRTVVETLCGMFPNLDREVIDDVVRQKQGRVGLAVDACLALTAGG